MDTIRLTKTVKKGGCAAKVAAEALHEMLSGLQFPPRHAELLIDAGTFDDAAVYRISDEIALVQTVDFFTPIVNDPYTFGQIAAANALSDVYAMGGVPKTCMAVLAFPIAVLPLKLGTEVLQGASDKIAEAGATLVGGHSIDDDTLKFGLSVTGFVHPDHIWSNAGVRPGDHLILTKAIGTGTLLAGLKSDAYSEADIEDAIVSMTALNKLEDVLSPKQRNAIRAATDVTGFGLVGHAMQMAKASDVMLEISIGKVPLFAKTVESLERSHLTKAHTTNSEYTSAACSFGAVSDIQRLIVVDPQTSGGLLLAVPPDFSAEILSSVQKRFPASRIIGSAANKSAGADGPAVKFAA